MTGRVQGVGYRRFVARVAGELGLAGTVRNGEDGSVEVEAWGPEADLDRLGTKLVSGPRFSDVTNVDSSAILDETSVLTGFHVID